MFVGTQSKDIWTLKALLWTRISPPIFFHAWLFSTCFKTTISENDTLDTTVWVLLCPNRHFCMWTFFRILYNIMVSHLCEFSCDATNDCYMWTFSRMFCNDTVSHQCAFLCARTADFCMWTFSRMFYNNMVSHLCVFLCALINDCYMWIFSCTFYNDTAFHLCAFSCV